MDSSISYRVRKIAEHYRLMKPVDFSKKTGFSHQAASNYLKGRTPSAEALVKIQQTFDNINPEWLLTGKGEMLRPPLPEKTSNSDFSRVTATEVSIPLLHSGTVIDFSDSRWSVTPHEIKDAYVIPELSEADFILRVKGNTMAPTYDSGNLIVCKGLVAPKFIQWGRVYVIITENQGILVKRLGESDKNDCMRLISDNKNYSPFDIPKSSIKGIALIIGSIRLE